MHDVPDQPPVDDATDVLAGHLWLQEFVDGTPFRFQLQAGGGLRFGDDRRTFDADDAPTHLRYAVHAIARELDRSALRRAVDDVESITLVGIATHRRRAGYDWQRLPGFLGTDVWDADAGESGEWLPPDRVEQVFDSLDLDPVNAVAKEVRAADFQPDRYEFPDSAWRDGPVAGVVVRNKTGGRAVLENPAVSSAEPTESDVDLDHDATPEERADRLADEFATDALFQRTADAIQADETRSLDFDSLQQAVLDSIYREHAPTFEHVSVDSTAFRRAVAERTSEAVGRLA